MEMSLDSLFDFVEKAVDAGIQGYLKKTEPAADRIKQADARRYIKRYGFQPVMLRKWVDARLLTPIKVGEKQNSAVWYSLADIKKVICTMQLRRITYEE